MDRLDNFVITFYNEEDRVTFWSDKDEGEPEILCNGEWIDKGNEEVYDYVKDKYGETRAKELFDVYEGIIEKWLGSSRSK